MARTHEPFQGGVKVDTLRCSSCLLTAACNWLVVAGKHGTPALVAHSGPVERLWSTTQPPV